jgi:hypothetical protein
MVCVDDARQLRSCDATVWGLDRVKIEKVTNAAQRSGGSSKLAFMRCGRVHMVCVDDARQ